MWKKLVVIALIAWGGHTWWQARAVTHQPGAGMLAPKPPVQTELYSEPGFERKGYRITPLAGFSVEARVLSRSNYSMGREADLSPTDLALGWGRMSDDAVLDHIDISQANRFYFWRVQEFPIPQSEIETSSGNMHLIPANSTVERQLDKVRRGQVVRMRGYLVRVEASDGWHWVSSLSRTDTGAGACEVVWVEDLTTL